MQIRLVMLRRCPVHTGEIENFAFFRFKTWIFKILDYIINRVQIQITHVGEIDSPLGYLVLNFFFIQIQRLAVLYPQMHQINIVPVFEKENKISCQSLKKKIKYRASLCNCL
jgi:hypothetical protein